MTVTIPDEIALKSGVTDRDLLIEIACRLFDKEKISKFEATSMTGLSRVEFENEMVKRGLPWIRISDADGLADIRQAEAERKRA